MKKFLKHSALLLCLLTSFGLVFTACGSDDDNDEKTKDTTVAVTGISISPSSAKLAAGENSTHASTTLSASVLPNNATNTNVTWSFSDGYDSYVDVTDTSKSEITITVKTDAEITATQTITATATAEGDTSKTDSATIKIYASDDDLKADSGITLAKNDEEAKPYATIKAALAAIPSDATASDTYTISLEAGTYEEVLYYKGAATVIIEGKTTKDYGSDVIIAAANNGELLKNSGDNGEKQRSLFEFEGTGNLILKNITIQNTYARTEADKAKKPEITQAEAFGFDSTGTVIAYNSSFLSHQDTVRTVGKAWFYKCYFEGDVDFLWMEQAGVVALYEDCEIKMVGDETTKAYVAAPGLKQASPVGKGLVVYNSKVIVDSALTTATLARTPWTSGKYNQVAYINTTVEGTLSSVWNGSPIATDFDKTDIGWKMDSTTAKNLDYAGKNDILSDRMTKREYNGRYVILNRVYNTSTSKYQTASALWDAAEALTKTGVEASAITEDASKNNIFLDYADLSKTSIGDELEVSDYTATAPSVTWSAKAYSSYENGTLSNEVSGVEINASTGAITNNYSGNVYVEVTATKGGASDSIIVYSVTATKIKLDATEATIAIGSSKTLTASFEPEGADAEVEWSSDSTNVEVSADGVVTVKSSATAGDTATITAKIKDTNLSATCTVTVAAAGVMYYVPAGEETLPTLEDGVVKTLSTQYSMLAYDVNLLDDSVTSATITANVNWSANNGHVGVGFFSTPDGLYNGVTGSSSNPSHFIAATAQGIKGIKATGFSVSTETDYTITATFTKNTSEENPYQLTFTAKTSNGTTAATSTLKYSDGAKFPASEYVHLTIGGFNGAPNNATFSNVSVSVTTSKGTDEKTISIIEALPTDTRTTLSVGTLTTAYEMTSSVYTSVKGANDTITLSKVDLPTTAPTYNSTNIDGSWQWDDGTVVYDGKNNPTTTASYIPTDRTAYQALLNQTVTISITDNRIEGTQYTYNVVSSTATANSDIQNGTVDNTSYGDGTHGNLVVDSKTYNSTSEGTSTATGKFGKSAGSHQTRNIVFYVPVDTTRVTTTDSASITLNANADGSTGAKNFSVGENVYGGSLTNKLSVVGGDKETQSVTYTFKSTDLVTKASETSTSVDSTVTTALDESKSYAKIIVRHVSNDVYINSISLTYTK